MNCTKKRITFSLPIIIAGFFALFMSCEDKKEATANAALLSNEQDLPAILKRGKLRVLAENSSTSFFIYKGKKMGFEYEILREFAEDIGVELEIIRANDLDVINEQLNNNEGDIIACNYVVTRDRQKEIVFSRPFSQTNQVLVQRKEEKLNLNSGDPTINYHITDPLQLAKRKIDIWRNSSYYDRLLNLQDEIGDTIYIRPTQGYKSTEELIELVSDGQIDYTVSEKNIATINEGFYDNLDVSMAISFKQNIAFGLSKNAPLLKKRLDQWLTRFIQRETYSFIWKKYFDPDEQDSSYPDNPAVIRKGGLSAFDAIMKAEAARHNFDWRLLAAIIQHESNFNPNAHAFGGAYGLMQFMPGTGPKYGVYPNSTPEVQIRGGMSLIVKIRSQWTDIKDPAQRNKFILASYNAGSGHIKDAQVLAAKRGYDPKVWDGNVEKMAQNLGKRGYYTDPDVKSGAFHGSFTCRYVREIIARYEQFKTMF